MCLVLFLMFVALISDKVGADMVMLGALTLCMAAKIITVEEGLEGFANEGLITVLVLFVVAAGISHTGALDWYMSKLLGRPSSAASAQLRLMIPIAIVSAFLNNTPVVAVMIPIVQRWGKNVGVSPQQLLVPLSFASILGGTCTLIGTSTNLVVVGLLNDRYPDVPSIGLFDLGQYGVPVMIAGIAYVLIASPFLLPGGSRSGGGDAMLPPDGDESILLGARLTKWSSAAGRSVKRSGLRDTGGLYLVSVHRAATGNVHRAVGQDFVLNVGDVLYFTGLVEEFGNFCEEHGLEVITNEVEETLAETAITGINGDETFADGADDSVEGQQREGRVVQFEEEPDVFEDHRDSVPQLASNEAGLSTIEECEQALPMTTIDLSPSSFGDLGTTKESLANSDDDERLRSINRMTDMIRGIAPSEPMEDMAKASSGPPRHNKMPSSNTMFEGGDEPAKIVVLTDTRGSQQMVIVGIDARDRPGLLLDISRGLLRMNLQLHHTEASVVEERSVSIWRCEVLDEGVSDIEEIWDILNALLEYESGIEAIKKRGLRVLRAVVTKKSRLVKRTATEVNFREIYQAAIVAVQRNGKNTTEPLSRVRFEAGDVLVLQASDDSPLLSRPPEDFYKKLAESRGRGSEIKGNSSVQSLVKFFRGGTGSNSDLAGMGVSKDENEKAHDTLSSTERSASRNSDIEGGGQVEEGFYIPEDGEPEGGGDSTSSPSNVANPIEELWVDLQVMFVDKTNDDAENGIPSKSDEQGNREFLTAMQIAPRSQLAKKTAVQSGIDKLPGVFLVSIERPAAHADDNATDADKRVKVITIPSDAMSASRAGSIDAASFLDAEPTLLPVAPDEPLKEGDILWFSGSANAVGDLRKIPGLKSYENDEVKKINEKVHDRRLVQAVVARKSPLVGKTVADVRFRTRYGAAVIAIHREGKRVYDHPGKVKLHAGDVLLLEAGPTFIQRNADNDRSFALLSEVEDSAPPRLRLLIPALALACAMLAVFTAGVASLLVCSLVAAILMVCIGILTQQEARDAVNWDIYITIACAFGIGTALTNSGVAGGVADFLVNVGKAVGLGDAGLYGAVYFATFLISNVVTNNAAAALIFPIAMDAAEQSGVDQLLMSYCLMLGASASFMSPFGYTTNLLIYGPGGYKYKDFLRIGTPMQIVLWILSVALLAQDSSGLPWYLSWIITSMILLVVSVARISNVTCGTIFSKCRRLCRRKTRAL